MDRTMKSNAAGISLEGTLDCLLGSENGLPIRLKNACLPVICGTSNKAAHSVLL